MKEINVHLVSDSTGETVSTISRAVMSQFEGVEIKEYVWSLIRTEEMLEMVLNSIEQNPGIVMYTIVEKNLREKLKEHCRKLNTPFIPVLARVVQEVSSYLNMKATPVPGRQHELDEDYFYRIDAMNFSISHDDGQSSWDIEDADIILVGVSRTSKSPTCVYLAHRGYKAANIPFVQGCPLPCDIEKLTKPMVIGLTINPDRLVHIRKNRLMYLTEDQDTSYVDIEKIREEVTAARKLFTRNNWPVIDVTRKSVEETSARIIKLYKDRKCKLSE